VIPSVGLGLYLESNKYQAALRWWLRLNTSGGVMCPFCPKTTLDSLGHHAVTCRHGGDVVIPHNLLRDIIADLCNLFSYSYSKYLHIFANLMGQFSLATRSKHICFLQCPELHVHNCKFIVPEYRWVITFHYIVDSNNTTNIIQAPLLTRYTVIIQAHTLWSTHDLA
jgi:hypothetical protein